MHVSHYVIEIKLRVDKKGGERLILSKFLSYLRREDKYYIPHFDSYEIFFKVEGVISFFSISLDSTPNKMKGANHYVTYSYVNNAI